LLDLDGTVIDIAPRPDAVMVPDCLVATLALLRDALRGALAVLTGRRLAEVDQLMGGVARVVAAEHGAVIRWPDGAVTESAQALARRDEWLGELVAAAVRWPGVLIEAKTHSLVAHYRQAPQHEVEVVGLVERMAATDVDGAEILRARKAIELRPRGIGKGSALRRLAATPPFRDRQPVFVGDDITDQDAIVAAGVLGGIGLHVGHDFAGSPAAVRQWLAMSAKTLARRGDNVLPHDA
jgi:trehalose 6-phosphate phosphatase